MRRLLTLAICILLLAASPVASGSARARLLTILHFNDIHGRLEPWKPDAGKAATIGGVARIAALVERVRRENRAAGRATILLEAGDILQGTPMSAIFRGEPDVDVFNMLGVDAMAFGNHEFDFGQENLARLIGLARYPVLGANIYRSDGRPFAPGTVVLEPQPGLRVGVIGLTTADTPSTTFPTNVTGLVFDDPVATARHAVPVLERQCDVVVALTHIGLPEDRRLAREVPGVDVVIGGHTHLALQSPEREGTTPICQAGDLGRFLGRIDLTLVDGRVEVTRAELIPIVDGMAENAAVRRLVGGYAARLRDRLTAVVGRSDVLLDGERPNVRGRETTLGNFVTDVVRSATHADVAVMNGGALRATIGAGTVTFADVITALPFENTIVVTEVPGRVLRSALDLSASLVPADLPGGFLQVSGLTYAIADRKAVDITVGGAPLDDDRSYSVAMPDFMLLGGDGYTMFAAGATRHVDTGLVVNNLVLDFFRSGGVASPRIEGRIVRR